MGQNRKNISIPDDANDILQALATDCGMDHSQCITQLLRRHHNDIRTLFSINVCSHTHDCTRIIETVPNLSQSNPVPMSTHTKPIAVEPSKPSLGPTIAATSESPADELARLQALPKLEKLKNMNRITELKELIED